MNLEDLKAPFPAKDVEWRVSRAGKKNGKVWAKVLAYITNRAIQDRLDEVCGPLNWKNDFWPGPQGGVVCGISIKDDHGEWVTKHDGADNTDFEAVKGGLSAAMKRAAVQWGIGRYLYNLDEGWADVGPNGSHYSRLPKDKGGDSFRWDPPELPVWALPSGDKANNGKEDEAREELAAMGDALDEMGEIGSSVAEMHMTVDQFLAGTGWTAEKKAAAKDWLYTRVTRIDSKRTHPKDK